MEALGRGRIDRGKERISRSAACGRGGPELRQRQRDQACAHGKRQPLGPRCLQVQQPRKPRQPQGRRDEGNADHHRAPDISVSGDIVQDRSRPRVAQVEDVPQMPQRQGQEGRRHGDAVVEVQPEQRDQERAQDRGRHDPAQNAGKPPASAVHDRLFGIARRVAQHGFAAGPEAERQRRKTPVTTFG